MLQLSTNPNQPPRLKRGNPGGSSLASASGFKEMQSPEEFWVRWATETHYDEHIRKRKHLGRMGAPVSVALGTGAGLGYWYWQAENRAAQNFSQLAKTIASLLPVIRNFKTPGPGFVLAGKLGWGLESGSDPTKLKILIQSLQAHSQGGGNSSASASDASFWAQVKQGLESYQQQYQKLIQNPKGLRSLSLKLQPKGFIKQQSLITLSQQPPEALLKSMLQSRIGVKTQNSVEKFTRQLKGITQVQEMMAWMVGLSVAIGVFDFMMMRFHLFHQQARRL
jgi:hypothetical protein